MKKIFKFIKLLILLILINQLIILISNDYIRKGWWKSNSYNQFNEHDFLEFDSNLNRNLNWNIITEKGNKSGIIQLFVGKNY